MADRSTGRRQVVKFSFFRADPAWRGLPAEERERGKQELCAAVDAFAGRLQVRSYSVAGLRGDADFLLWQIGERLEDVQQQHTALLSTALGPYLSMPYSYLAMTRRSVYVSPEEAEARVHLHPADSKYLFVYPFVKTREWYQLPLPERQAMMNEHIAVGRRYPSVKLNTAYSFGLDDQEFVVSFETDEPADFLDLVMELREAKSSKYTLRDTPAFTCISMGLRETLDTLGGQAIGQSSNQAIRQSSTQVIEPGASVAQGPRISVAQGPSPERPAALSPDNEEWQRVASVTDIAEGGSKVVYYEGQQVALFNAGGRFYAIANRCSHASGPLADGRVDGEVVTCPYHDSQFDLNTGEPVRGPANRPLPAYRVRVKDGEVFLAARAPAADTLGVADETGG